MKLHIFEQIRPPEVDLIFSLFIQCILIESKGELLVLVDIFSGTSFFLVH